MSLDPESLVDPGSHGLDRLVLLIWERIIVSLWKEKNCWEPIDKKLSHDLRVLRPIDVSDDDVIFFEISVTKKRVMRS
jgi:hypothetical protein